MNRLEKVLVDNPLRALVLRHYEAKLLERLGGDVAGTRVLDIGCGSGLGTEVILQRLGAGSVVGIDIDPDLLERARRRLTALRGRAAVVRSDATAIQARDHTFDAVFSFQALHHIASWRDAIHEVARVLRPGGRFYFEETTQRALEGRLSRRLFLHPDDRFSGPALIAACEGAGLPVGDRWVERLGGTYIFGVATNSGTGAP